MTIYLILSTTSVTTMTTTTMMMMVTMTAAMTTMSPFDGLFTFSDYLLQSINIFFKKNLKIKFYCR
eukprot:m.49373 g.49373  ORF g.49373 m.49373 type:complete len:66 (+) comp10862_c0_seq1:1617-1814(+)